MHLTIEDLIAAIDAATQTVEVKVDSTDYYRRAGDLDTHYLTYVCPNKLKDALAGLAESKRAQAEEGT